MTITIADGRGALWQWDTGRRLRVGSGVEQIHYQNKCFGRSVDVDVGTDGTAIIPDELLQDWHPLTAYAYVTDDTGAYTMVQQDFVVHKRAKPAGYVYTPTDQMTLQTIQRQIGDLADLTTEAKGTLVAAINEVAASGGAGSMDLRVADGYIQYSTDGGSTWQNLIAVADLKGADGITPHIGDNGNWHIGSTDTGKPSRGAVGLQGKPGKTPVRGTDYWTAADKQEIVNDIHPAFYIDLAGDYPNYTCPVAIDDIKAAYNSGYNLVCRCTLAAYTATLPLFVPAPAANTWIFSGSGALKSMGFDAQSFTVAITASGVSAWQTMLSKTLKISVGTKEYLYNGSEPVNVVIDDGTEVSY